MRLNNKWIILIALHLIMACKIQPERHDQTETHSRQGENSYACPMKCEADKTYNEPGKCPVCNMILQAVEDEIIQIAAPNQQVLSNQATIRPQLGRIGKEFKSPGYIVPARDRNQSVVARFGGRVEKLYIKYNNQYVRKGDKILDIYSPVIRTIQEEHLFLVNSAAEKSLIEKSRERQRLLGITDDQIYRLEKNGSMILTVTVYSPANGYVFFTTADTQLGLKSIKTNTTNTMSMGQATAKENSFEVNNEQLREGMYVNNGQLLFNINDLQELWAMVTIPNEYLSKVKVNQFVKIIAENRPSIKIDARVSFIEQTFEELNQRFARARVVLPNRNFSFSINMLVTAQITINEQPEMLIPASAVYQTGLNSYVWVKSDTTKHGTGIFRARRVLVATAGEGNLVIKNGLDSTEAIALEAGLMIDSETFLKEY